MAHKAHRRPNCSLCMSVTGTNVSSMSKVKSVALCPPNRGGVTFRSYKAVKGPGNNTDRLISFFTQLTFLAVWKSLTTLSAPIARVLAVYIWAGRSFVKLCSWSERVLLKLVGWLASPAFPHSRWLQQWGRHYVPLDVRKWHVVACKRTNNSRRCA